jgi:hypothetical protein
VLLYLLPPTITQQPAAQNVCPGATAIFTVQASGAGLSYQWQKNQLDLSNGGDISGVDTATLEIANVDSSDAANYRCVVSNDAGDATSDEAALTVKAATAITQHPAPQEVDYAATAAFTVSASGEGTLTYQWQKDQEDLTNGGDISGVDTPALQIANVDAEDVGDYRCVVTGDCGSATSQEEALTLTAAPGDFDRDDDVDMEDFGHLQVCLTGMLQPQDDPECQDAKLDGDADVDQADVDIFLGCLTGANMPADHGCAD